jgi:Tfp pilus assembly protein PilV
MEKEQESDLMNTFKVAANSLALLYKESHNQSRKAYVSGYQQALQDLWEFMSLKQSSYAQPMIPVQEILGFIQSKHTETEKKPVWEVEPITAPSLATFNPELSHSITQITTPDFSDSLKRRWEFDEASKHMNLDVDQLMKRPRTRSDRMSD